MTTLDTASPPQELLETVNEQTFPVGTRTIATLPGFLPKRHAWQLFQGSNFLDSPKTYKELDTLWQEAKRRSALAPIHLSGFTQTSPKLTQITPLPKSVSSFEQELMSRPTFERWYADTADYRLWCVPACTLVTPQWYADTGYIEQLAKQAPQPGQWKEVLDFVFGEGLGIEEPVLCLPNANTAMAVFRSPANNLRAIQPPAEPLQIQRRSAHELEITVRVQTAPNYLQVARIRGKHVLVNGIRHSCALLKAGWEVIPCLVREARSLQEVGFAPGQLGLISELEEMARPPYICDFLEHTIAHTFHQRPVDQVMRVVVQAESTFVTRM